MNGRLPNCYEPNMVSFVTSTEKLIHTVNQQRQQQLELLDTHPLFTGRCPRCEMTYPQYETPAVHGIVRLAGRSMIRCEDGSRRFCFDNGDRYLLFTAFMLITFWLRLNKLNKELWFFK
jgi:hypothetical protein